MNRHALRSILFAVLLLALPGASPLRAQNLEIYCIEVGIDGGGMYKQGDSTLVISPTGTRLLIDGGAGGLSGSDSVLALFSRVIPTGGLDYIVTTHWDEDHIDGLDNIASANGSQYLPAAVYDLGDAASQGSVDGGYKTLFANIQRTPSVGDTIDLGGGCIATFVSVDGHTYGGGYTDPGASSNARSIGLLIRYGGFDYLTLGDLEMDCEDVLAPALAADGVAVDVLHVSHHGASTATSNDFVSAILPEFAVISCGDNNGNGHPHQNAINRLNGLTTSGLGYFWPPYNPVTRIYALEQGDTGAGTAPNVTVVGAGHDTEPTLQGSLKITVSNPGCTYSFTNEGPPTTYTINDGPYPVDENFVSCPTVPTPTPTPVLCTVLGEETFEGAWAPVGWQKGTTTLNNSIWHSASHSALINGSTDYLITPLLVNPGILVYWFRTSDTPGGFKVEYSPTGTVPWTPLPGPPATMNYGGVFEQETVNLSGYPDGYIRFGTSGTTYHYVDDVMVTCPLATPTPPSGSDTVLNLKVYLEGLYAGSGVMNAAMDVATSSLTIIPKWANLEADQIGVELHEATNYGAPVSTATVQLHMDGTASVQVTSVPPGSYYITVRHRNHLETTTAAPVLFTGMPAVSYDFSDNVNKAYGGNQKDVGGTAVVYAGDVSSAGHDYPGQAVADGTVDITDAYYLYGSFLNGDFGYMVGDVTGDGVVDLSDVYMAFDNYLLGVYAVLP